MTESVENKSVIELLMEIDNELNVLENSKELLTRCQDNDNALQEVLGVVDARVTQKVAICNLLAITGYENECYDLILPLLEKALEYDSYNKDTLINLSVVLAEFGEKELAISYAMNIKEKSQDVIDLIERLTGNTVKSTSGDILTIEQNDVAFTGERLVINKEVKDNYSNVLEEHIHRYLLASKYVEDKMVLDAACGAGYGSKMLQQAGAKFVLGVDISEESLQNASKVYGADNVDFVYGDVNRLAIEDDSFDVVVSFETIEHLESGAHWIRESARILKDDGLFLVSTPNRLITNPGTYYVEKPFNPHHKFEYSVTEFVGELLKEYDILELFGQTFSNDNNTYYSQVMRQLRKMNAEFIPEHEIQATGHELVSLGDVKDAQPMYVVAVCRKKQKRILPNVTEVQDGSSNLNNNSTAHNSRSIQNLNFYKFGINSYIADGYEIVGAEAISIGDNVLIKKDCWLNIAVDQFKEEPQIIIEEGCQIGKNFTISVANKVVVEKHVIVGPNVYIADCGHAYENISLPIIYQGVTSTKNEVSIGEGSWLGINSVIVGNVRVGKGCVIAANTFVNKDIPDYSVAVGNPARVIKMFDSASGDWVKVKNNEEIHEILKRRKEISLSSIMNTDIQQGE
ncbi:methyltransferase domain-containing protein [Paenibacillus alba]|uniref:methyltransferase domain-containing protein n=1 Tax=Paenibacillus alba TaxID=1197127 RepID=UPI001564A4E0|nr:methyltransferase domain-containing protein [Paenibacillus alba]NQX70102.1 methyltransferase domain-containing protein [Paenibacillus alba]